MIVNASSFASVSALLFSVLNIVKPSFLTAGSRWRTKNLKYKIMSWPTRLQNNKEGVREAIRDAFTKWSDVSGLTFEEVSATSKSNIEIR